MPIYHNGLSKGAKVEKKDPSLQKDHIKTSISPSFSPSKAPLLYLDTKGGVLTEAGEETANSSLEGNKDITFISEFKGLFFKYPLLSISFAVSLFSMAGIPPLIGFFSKQLVLYSALQNGYYSISVLAIIVSVISCSYYLQIIKLLFTPSSLEKTKAKGAKNEIIITNTHSYLISTLTFTILLFFIKPSLILNSTQLLSLSLFYI